MSKSEVIAEIMNELKFQDSASFEADEIHSYDVYKTDNGYQLRRIDLIQNFPNATELRKAIAKCGKTLLWM